jgi:hypothetical protein
VCDPHAGGLGGRYNRFSILFILIIYLLLHPHIRSVCSITLILHLTLHILPLPTRS